MKKEGKKNFEKIRVQKFRVSDCNEISVPKLRKIKYFSGHENSKMSKEFSLTSKIHKKFLLTKFSKKKFAQISLGNRNHAKFSDVIFLLSIIIIFLLYLVPFMIASVDINKTNFVHGEIVIKYKENVVGNGSEIFLKDNNELVVYTFIERPEEITKIGKSEIYHLKFNESNVDTIISQYEKIEEIEYIDKNYLFKTFKAPDDANYSLKWELHNINAEHAWNLTIGNSSVVIAIIDTGVDWDHPDLANNIWNNSDEFCNTSLDNDGNGYNGDCRGYDFVNVSSGCGDNDCNDEDNNPMDNHGHGTHVAGIAAAVSNNNLGMTGVCWNCSIMAVRGGYKDSDGNGALTLADVVQALHYAADNNATIISMSFGGSHSASLQDAINYSYNKSSVLVASSGNAGTNTQIYPCAYDNVVCVAAIDDDNTSASYSNYGNWIKLAAPGTSIWSTYFDDTYVSSSGTSMAAPVVAGAIGLIKTLFTGKNQTEIENALNNTGSPVNFTSVILSRINVYSAILELDNISSNVSLISPTDNRVNLTLNQTFFCNATDWQLKNITIQIWNSTHGLFYNESKNVTGIFNESSFNVTMDYGKYKWNCLVYDNKSNYAYANANFSLFVENISVSLISPVNYSYTNTNETNFNCSAESESTSLLSNISFRLHNLTELIYNLTNTITGTSNSSLFNYNFSSEDRYYWNCLAYNNLSEFSLHGNFTFIYDITAPNVTALDPSNGTSYSASSQNINFGYNVSDNFNVSNCSLIINNQINTTNSTINLSLIQNFSIDFGEGNYNWKVQCTDSALNKINSSERSFSISAPVSSTTSSGGGGGGSAITASLSKTYVISNEQSTSGYSEKLKKGDKIKFPFFDEKSARHTLIVNNVGNDFVNLTINSTPIHLVLGVGQSILLNLTSPDYYDLFVKLKAITNNSADITIQTIHQPIIKQKISGEVVEDILEVHKNETFEKEFEEEIGKLNQDIKELKFILGFFVFFIIIIIIFLLFRNKKNEKINDYKKIIKKKKKGYIVR